MKKALFAIAAMSLLFASAAVAEQDDPTYAARLIEAKAYLKVAPVSKVIDEVMDGVAKNPRSRLTSDDLKRIRASIDTTGLDKIMQDALVKDFTLDELKMMVQFFGSNTGRSILHKMPGYMGEVMPPVGQRINASMNAYLKKKYPQQTQQRGSAAPAAASRQQKQGTPAPAAAQQPNKTGE